MKFQINEVKVYLTITLRKADKLTLKIHMSFSHLN